MAKLTAVDAESPFGWNEVPKGEARHVTRMLIAVVAMFLQQSCGSVGRVLPAVLAPAAGDGVLIVNKS